MSESAPSMPGGYTGPSEEITEEEVAVLESVREGMEAEANASFAECTLIAFRRQVVAGLNYHMKVRVAGEGEEGNCAHVRIFKPLPHTGQPARVTAIELGKNEQDALE